MTALTKQKYCQQQSWSYPIYKYYNINSDYYKYSKIKQMKKSHLLLVLFLIIFGAMNTIFLGLQNKQNTPDASPNSKFFHPFIQTAIMFLGQTLCFIPYIVYLISKRKRNFLQQSGFMKKQCPIYLPIIPAIMDLLSSALAYISLNLIAGSVWQISRGGVIITTAIFSKIFLKKTFTNNSILGCVLAFVGITVVQIFQIFLKDSSSSDTYIYSTAQQIVGIVLLLASLIFNTIALIVEKDIFNKYNIHPIKMVFLEGIYGLVGMSLIILSLNFIECPQIGTIRDKCIIYDGKYFIQNVPVFFQQISKNFILLSFIIGLIFSIGISVPLAVTISKVINPVSRSLADVCRTVLIWSAFLLLTVTVGKQDSSYKLEQTGLQLNLLKLIGFLLVIVGTLTYHQIIKFFKDPPEQVLNSLLESEVDIDKYSRKSKDSNENLKQSTLEENTKQTSSKKQNSRESLI